jgi:hypothetical protein
MVALVHGVDRSRPPTSLEARNDIRDGMSPVWERRGIRVVLSVALVFIAESSGPLGGIVPGGRRSRVPGAIA